MNDDDLYSKRPKIKFVFIIAVIAFVVSTTSIAVSIWLYFGTSTVINSTELLQRQLDSLKIEILNVQIDLITLKWKQELADLENAVDFSNPNLQDIGGSFHVGKLAITQHLTGVKVKGRMINSTALRQDNITFSITLAEQTKEFTINRISSGNSTAFNVYIPNVPIDKTQYGTIKYISSTVWYKY